MILKTDGPSTNLGDRCGAYVSDPDSPLCDSCEIHHRVLIEEGIEFAMIPLNHR